MSDIGNALEQAVFMYLFIFTIYVTIFGGIFYGLCRLFEWHPMTAMLGHLHAIAGWLSL